MDYFEKRFKDMRNICIMMMLTAILFLVSCEKDNPNPINENGKSLVDNIYYNNDLIAHFEYNKNSQLIKREYFDPFIIGTKQDMLFYYKDSLVSKIEYVDYNLNTTYVDSFYYANNGKIEEIKTYENEQLLETYQLGYSDNGFVESVIKGSNDKSIFEYDMNGNVVKTTKYFNVEGHETIVECQLGYDSGKKPNFGLNLFAGVDLLPWRGNTSNWEQSLSNNNIIKEYCHEKEYIIEYNEDDYPISITTKQQGIDTEEPLIIEIEYKMY
jgi:hypothetical protein